MGVVQGLTEFLPVSSSGHLALARHLLGVGLAEDVGFEVAVHAGTLLAVILFFSSRIKKIIHGTITGENDGRLWFIWLVVGTVPAGIIGLAFKDNIATLFNDLTLVGLAWIVTAAMLFASEFHTKEVTSASRMGVWRAILIGFAQAFALIPGISRSGSTISAGLISGVKKDEIVDFIFILSLPSVGGATLLTIPDWLDGSVSFALPHIIGGIAAGISGFISIKWMIKIVAKAQLRWFAVYCFIVGIFALVIG